MLNSPCYVTDLQTETQLYVVFSRLLGWLSLSFSVYLYLPDLCVRVEVAPGSKGLWTAV